MLLYLYIHVWRGDPTYDFSQSLKYRSLIGDMSIRVQHDTAIKSQSLNQLQISVMVSCCKKKLLWWVVRATLIWELVEIDCFREVAVVSYSLGLWTLQPWAAGCVYGTRDEILIVVQVSSPIMQLLIIPKIKSHSFTTVDYFNSPIISEVHGLCYCVVPPITSLPWQPVHPSHIMKAINVIECFLIIQLQTIVNESHHRIGEKLAQISRKKHWVSFCLDRRWPWNKNLLSFSPKYWNHSVIGEHHSVSHFFLFS